MPKHSRIYELVVKGRTFDFSHKNGSLKSRYMGFFLKRGIEATVLQEILQELRLKNIRYELNVF